MPAQLSIENATRQMMQSRIDSARAEAIYLADRDRMAHRRLRHPDAKAIRFHASRGMSRKRLTEIYGATMVNTILPLSTLKARDA